MKTRYSILFLLLFLLFSLTVNASDLFRQYSGMDKVVLKPSNEKGKKNQLKQEMFYKLVNGTRVPCTNTIFVIQDVFDLAEDITIPSDCVLEFEGGALRNGRINTNGCYIETGLYQVFDNVELNKPDTYNGELEVIDNIYVKVLSDNSFVNKKTNTIIAANSIVNRRYIYRITGTSSYINTNEHNVTIAINGQKYPVANVISENNYILAYDYSKVIGIINASGEMASGEVKSFEGITFYTISPLAYIKNSTVKNKEIHPEWFGAKGDNKNDDSYAFNSALDLAYYSDSKVIVGNGVYRIDDALVVHTHTHLVGVVPTVEHPIKGCFTVNTDIGILIFDKYNPSGSYVLNNFGLKPFSDNYKYNFTGIRIYHSQNCATISNIGILNPKVGIEVDAIGGVQTLRCDNISVWCHENKGSIAVTAKSRLCGWFNGNYFRLSRTAHCGGVQFNGGTNIIDGVVGETNTGDYFLISLDQGATLIVKGGLYNENGKFAKLRNSSKLKIEGDNYIIGPLDCDETSCVVYTSQNFQTKRYIINNSVVFNDVVIAHYKVFPKKTTLWYETINNRIVKPLSIAEDYKSFNYNGRIFTTGYCKIPINDIDIKNKTIVIRVISPVAYTSSQRSHPIILNEDKSKQSIIFSQARSISMENASVLYAPGEVNLGYIEKGERYIFIPSKQEEFLLNSFTSVGNSSFLISDIYIIDEDSKDITGNEELRILDILSSLDEYIQYDGFLYGYNKGASNERPTYLTREDEGFEYFDTTLHKPIYWTGNTTIGDNGWVDATGNHPNPKQ